GGFFVASTPKIKIADDTELRKEIEKNTELINQVGLAKWAISVAKHVLPYLEKEFPEDERILSGIETNELWQKGETTVHQVRQAGFKVHERSEERRVGKESRSRGARSRWKRSE